MKLYTLDAWLEHIGQPTGKMLLGLERVQVVASAMQVNHPTCPVITVAGTNGKGSTVAGLEAIYRSGLYRVGVFTSPYLQHFTEQVRIDGQTVSEDAWCEAFEVVEAHLNNTQLTAFEYTTLAALWLLQRQKLDVMILEVGLGGRLDAVNCVDANLAIVTSIALDHEAWLGNTREAIGFEKAGIFRQGAYAICGDPNPPKSLEAHAKKIGAQYLSVGDDFHYQEETATWDFISKTYRARFPQSDLIYIENRATILMAVTVLQRQLPVSDQMIEKAWISAILPARIEVKPLSNTRLILDVAHNPHAIAHLAQILCHEKKVAGKTFAVFSMLEDKDITACMQILKSAITHWFIAPIAHARAASLTHLQEASEKAGIEEKTFSPTLVDAYQLAHARAKEGDQIVVCGSFHTVGAIMTHLSL